MNCTKCGREHTNEIPVEDGICKVCKYAEGTNMEPVVITPYGKVYKQKENWLMKLWNKTIFPDIIRKRRERKEWERRLKAEAEVEARPEIEKAYKEQYKKEMIAKMKGEKQQSKGKGAMDKLAEGFGVDPKKPKKEIDIAGMMGMGGGSGDKTGMGSLNTSDEKIKSMIGLGNRGEVMDEMLEKKKKKSKKKKKKSKKKQTKVEEKNPFDVSDKIAEMLK